MSNIIEGNKILLEAINVFIVHGSNIFSDSAGLNFFDLIILVLDHIVHKYPVSYLQLKDLFLYSQLENVSQNLLLIEYGGILVYIIFAFLLSGIIMGASFFFSKTIR
jgi:hypothetical protein